MITLKIETSGYVDVMEIDNDLLADDIISFWMRMKSLIRALASK